MSKNLSRMVMSVAFVGLVGMVTPSIACEMNKKSEKTQTTTNATEKNKGEPSAKTEQKTTTTEKKPNS